MNNDSINNTKIETYYGDNSTYIIDEYMTNATQIKKLFKELRDKLEKEDQNALSQVFVEIESYIKDIETADTEIITTVKELEKIQDDEIMKIVKETVKEIQEQYKYKYSVKT